MTAGRHWLITATLIGWSFVPPAGGDTAIFGASKDNTLYESEFGQLSNGAGMHMFTGRTGSGFFQIRRALVAFDIAGNIPTGATIVSVELRLNMSRARFSGDRDTSLHRVLADWGEGTSNAGGQEGGGRLPYPAMRPGSTHSSTPRNGLKSEATLLQVRAILSPSMKSAATPGALPRAW